MALFKTHAHTRQLASAGKTLTVNKPTGTVEGDLMVAHIVHMDFPTGPSSISPPAGWTTVYTANGSSATGYFYAVGLYMKVATGSEPASYDFTRTAGNDSGSVYCTGIIYRFEDAEMTPSPSYSASWLGNFTTWSIPAWTPNRTTGFLPADTFMSGISEYPTTAPTETTTDKHIQKVLTSDDSAVLFYTNRIVGDGYTVNSTPRFDFQWSQNTPGSQIGFQVVNQSRGTSLNDDIYTLGSLGGLGANTSLNQVPHVSQLSDGTLIKIYNDSSSAAIVYSTDNGVTWKATTGTPTNWNSSSSRHAAVTVDAEDRIWIHYNNNGSFYVRLFVGTLNTGTGALTQLDDKNITSGSDQMYPHVIKVIDHPDQSTYPGYKQVILAFGYNTTTAVSYIYILRVLPGTWTYNNDQTVSTTTPQRGLNPSLITTSPMLVMRDDPIGSGNPHSATAPEFLMVHQNSSTTNWGHYAWNGSTYTITAGSQTTMMSRSSGTGGLVWDGTYYWIIGYSSSTGMVRCLRISPSTPGSATDDSPTSTGQVATQLASGVAFPDGRIELWCRPAEGSPYVGGITRMTRSAGSWGSWSRIHDGTGDEIPFTNSATASTSKIFQGIWTHDATPAYYPLNFTDDPLGTVDPRDHMVVLYYNATAGGGAPSAWGVWGT